MPSCLAGHRPVLAEFAVSLAVLFESVGAIHLVRDVVHQDGSAHLDQSKALITKADSITSDVDPVSLT
ncbi:MAG: hypothetical protein JSU86_11485 [Phycisphaerales bacterium]|nr:MAG: hypothetical protein JSU86_11485 [Phycisphaerales bacterium]